MIGGRRVLGLITARGGSQGIPRKNLRLVGGRPLIAWTIAAGLGARAIDRLVLSSDDPEIMDTAAALGCEVPFRRPPELATNEADSLSVVRHALDAVPGYDILVLLQPTSPLRTAADIDAALAVAIQVPDHTVFSAHPIEKAGYLLYRPLPEGGVRHVVDIGAPIGRRQDLPPLYAQNGAVYCAGTAHLAAGGGFVSAATRLYVMPRDRAFDVDEPLDLVVVDALLRARTVAE